MIKKNKRILRNVAFVTVLTWALIATYTYFKFKSETLNNEKRLGRLEKGMIYNRELITKHDTTTKYLLKPYLKDFLPPKKDSIIATLLKVNVDSAAKAVKTAAELHERNNQLLASRDTSKDEKNEIVILQRENKSLKEARKNLTVIVQDLDGKLADVNGQEKNFDAKISFPQKKSKGLFALNRYYVRVENLRDTDFMVNHGRYYDRLIKNPSLNEFLIQLRSSYNFGRSAASFGAGVELKVGRVGVNAAYLVDPLNLQIRGLSFGGRYDLKQFRFP